MKHTELNRKKNEKEIMKEEKDDRSEKSHEFFIFSILNLLDHRIVFQLQYELIFCLWMLSFEDDIVNRMKE